LLLYFIVLHYINTAQQTASLYSAWSGCSTSCGVGVQSRVKHCDARLAHGCTGPVVERRACTLGCCAGILSLFDNPELNIPDKKLVQ